MKAEHKTTPTKQVARLFSEHQSRLNALMYRASTKSNPALYLLEHDARTMAFYGQAMARLLLTQHNPKRLEKLRAHYKCLEDGLGQMDYWRGLLQAIVGNRQVPSAVRTYWKEQYQQAQFAMNEYLIHAHWLGGDAAKVPSKRQQKIQQHLDKIDWLSDKKLHKLLTEQYQKALKSLQKTISEPQKITELEAHLHELRRDVRWLSIYPQAFFGFIRLQPQAELAPELKKYATPTIRHSPFNQLPTADDAPEITAAVWLHQPAYWAMSYFIAKLGEIKDQAQLLDAMAHALVACALCEPRHVQARAKEILASRFTMAGWLKSAQALCVKFNQDQVFRRLMVVDAATEPAQTLPL